MERRTFLPLPRRGGEGWGEGAMVVLSRCADLTPRFQSSNIPRLGASLSPAEGERAGVRGQIGGAVEMHPRKVFVDHPTCVTMSHLIACFITPLLPCPLAQPALCLFRYSHDLQDSFQFGVAEKRDFQCPLALGVT